MSQHALADLLSQLRDDYADKPGTFTTIRDGILKGIANGTTAIFTFERFPVWNVSGVSVPVVRVNGAVVLVASYTLDAINGELTFGTAPAANARVSSTFSWMWFDDDTWYRFMSKAAEDLGYAYAAASTTASAQATDVAAQLPDGLLGAWKQYAGYHYNLARAETWASRFAGSAGGLSANVDVVTKSFMDLANACKTTANELKTAYYQRFGQRDAPAWATSSTPITLYQPKR